MMRLILPCIFFTAILFAATTVSAQVKFTASVSAPQISKNEMVQVRFAVENAKAADQITPPAFTGFIVVSGPSQETGMTSINGSVTQYVALTYILRPKGPGTYSIAPATARADGKELKSNAVTIKVTNTVSQNAAPQNTNPLLGFNPFDEPVETPFNDYILKKGENVTDKINRNMFVRLQTDKTSCFLGEPVVATYKLYTRLKSESNVVKNPSFSGFSVIDLQQPDNLHTTRETINGREYNVYIIRKVQLYPLQTGNLELEPVQVENNIQFIKEEYASQLNDALGDVFRDFADAAIPAAGIESQKITLQNKPATILVKALPAENVPASFKGATGKFTVKSGIEKTTFSTDDAGKLDVLIEGEGNMQLFTAPDIKWPNGIEAFEPTATDDVVKTTVPVSGRKLFSWNFTAAEPGEYVLPPVVFSYFDPATGKYKTDSSKPVTFTVTKGTGKKAAPVVVKDENKSWLNTFFSNRRRVVSTVAALIAIGLLLWLKKDKRKEEKIQQQKVETETVPVEPEVIAMPEKNYLENAAMLLNGDSADFYKELNTALKEYLADLLQRPVATLNKKTITDELDKKNVSTGTVIQLQQLLNSIEMQLYAPFAEKEKMHQLYNEAAELTELLNTYKNQVSANL